MEIESIIKLTSYLIDLKRYEMRYRIILNQKKLCEFTRNRSLV